MCPVPHSVSAQGQKEQPWKYTVKSNPFFRYSHSCFGYEGPTGEERNLVTFEDKPIIRNLQASTAQFEKRRFYYFLV